MPVLSVRPEPAKGSLKASTGSARTVEAIAEAAHKLTTLRDNRLNPPDWTQRLPEVVPLGMTTSPYPDRIVPKPGHEKSLSDRTLTKLYNARPAWLASAHAALQLPRRFAPPLLKKGNLREIKPEFAIFLIAL